MRGADIPMNGKGKKRLQAAAVQYDESMTPLR